MSLIDIIARAIVIATFAYLFVTICVSVGHDIKPTENLGFWKAFLLGMAMILAILTVVAAFGRVMWDMLA